MTNRSLFKIHYIKQTSFMILLAYGIRLQAITVNSSNTPYTNSSTDSTQYVLDGGVSFTNTGTLNFAGPAATVTGLNTPSNASTISLTNGASNNSTATIGILNQSYKALDFSNQTSNIPALTTNNYGIIYGVCNLGNASGNIYNIMGGTSYGVTNSGANGQFNGMAGSGNSLLMGPVTGFNQVNVNSGNLILRSTITGYGSNKLIINSGTLQLNSGAGLDASSGLNLNGGTLSFGASLTNPTLGPITVTANSIINNNTYSPSLNAPVTLTNGLTLAGTGTATLSGALSGAGAIGMQGAGTWILSGNNSNYTGSITVKTGCSLSMSSDTNLGATNSSLTLNGGTLTINGSPTISHGITLSASSSTINMSGAPVLQGVIQGNYDLNVTGTGTLALNGSNTFTGNVSANAAKLKYISTSSFGNSANVIKLAGYAGIINLPNGSFPRAIVTSGGMVSSATGTTSMDGVISGSGYLTYSGGNFVVTQTNTYTGGTHLYPSTVVSVANDANLGGNGTIYLEGGTLSLSQAFNSARVVNVNAASTLANNGFAVTFSGAFSGTGLLSVSGSGVTTLSGNNSNTGGIAMLAGSNLTITGSQTGSVTLNGGTTLNFNGLLANASATTLLPSSPLGSSSTINITQAGSATLGASGYYALDFRGTTGSNPAINYTNNGGPINGIIDFGTLSNSSYTHNAPGTFIGLNGTVGRNQHFQIYGTVNLTAPVTNIDNIGIHSYANLTVAAGHPITNAAYVGIGSSATAPATLTLNDAVSTASVPINLGTTIYTVSGGGLNISNGVNLYISGNSFLGIKTNATGTGQINLVGNTASLTWNNTYSASSLNSPISGTVGTGTQAQTLTVAANLTTNATYPISNIDIVSIAASKTLTINNSITNTKGAAIPMTTICAANSTLNIASGGSLQGAVALSEGTSVSNAGNLLGGTYSLISASTLAATTAINISNSATGSLGTVGQMAIDFSSGENSYAPSVSVTNAGTISGNIHLGSGTANSFTATGGSFASLTGNASANNSLLLSGGSSATSGIISNMTSTQVASGATWVYNLNSTSSSSLGALSNAGTTTFNNSSSGSVNLSLNTLNNSGSLNANMSFTITGTTSSALTHSGTLNLNDAITLTVGGATLNAGTIVANGSGASGTLSLAASNSSAVFSYNSASKSGLQALLTGSSSHILNINSNFQTQQAISGIGSINVASGQLFEVANAVTGSQNTHLASNASISIEANGSLAGNLSGDGQNTLNVMGTYTQAGNLNNINTININTAGTWITASNQSITTAGVYLDGGATLNNYTSLAVTGATTLNPLPSLTNSASITLYNGFTQVLGVAGQASLDFSQATGVTPLPTINFTNYGTINGAINLGATPNSVYTSRAGGALLGDITGTQNCSQSYDVYSSYTTQSNIKNVDHIVVHTAANLTLASNYTVAGLSRLYLNSMGSLIVNNSVNNQTSPFQLTTYLNTASGGGTTISDGVTLWLANASNLASPVMANGTGNITLVGNNATLTWNNSYSSDTLNAPINGVAGTGSQTQTLIVANNLMTTANCPISNIDVVSVAAGQSLTVNNTISNTKTAVVMQTLMATGSTLNIASGASLQGTVALSEGTSLNNAGSLLGGAYSLITAGTLAATTAININNSATGSLGTLGQMAIDFSGGEDSYAPSVSVTNAGIIYGNIHLGSGTANSLTATGGSFASLTGNASANNSLLLSGGSSTTSGLISNMTSTQVNNGATWVYNLNSTSSSSLGALSNAGTTTFNNSSGGTVNLSLSTLNNSGSLNANMSFTITGTASSALTHSGTLNLADTVAVTVGGATLTGGSISASGVAANGTLALASANSSAVLNYNSNSPTTLNAILSGSAGHSLNINSHCISQKAIQNIGTINVAANQILEVSSSITGVATTNLYSGSQLMIKGGQLSGAIQGHSGSLSIYSDYATSGNITGVDLITVISPANFTINNTISGYNASNGLNVALGASLTLNSGGSVIAQGLTVSGTLVYAGGQIVGDYVANNAILNITQSEMLNNNLSGFQQINILNNLTTLTNNEALSANAMSLAGGTTFSNQGSAQIASAIMSSTSQANQTITFNNGNGATLQGSTACIDMSQASASVVVNNAGMINGSVHLGPGSQNVFVGQGGSFGSLTGTYLNNNTLQITSGTNTATGLLTNLGTVDIAAGASLIYNDNASTASLFGDLSNAGTLQLNNVSAGSTSISFATCNNSGSLSSNTPFSVVGTAGSALTNSGELNLGSQLLTLTGGSNSGTILSVSPGGLMLSGTNASFTHNAASAINYPISGTSNSNQSLVIKADDATPSTASISNIDTVVVGASVTFRVGADMTQIKQTQLQDNAQLILQAKLDGNIVGLTNNTSLQVLTTSSATGALTNLGTIAIGSSNTTAQSYSQMGSAWTGIGTITTSAYGTLIQNAAITANSFTNAGGYTINASGASANATTYQTLSNATSGVMTVKAPITVASTSSGAFSNAGVINIADGVNLSAGSVSLNDGSLAANGPTQSGAIVLVGANASFTYNANSPSSMTAQLSGSASHSLNVQQSMNILNKVSNLSTINVSANAVLNIYAPVIGSQTINLAANAAVSINAGASLSGQIIGSSNSTLTVNSSYSPNGSLTGLTRVALGSTGALTLNPAYALDTHVFTLDGGSVLNTGQNLAVNNAATLTPAQPLTSAADITINNTGILGVQAYDALDFSSATGATPNVIVNNSGSIVGNVQFGPALQNQFNANGGSFTSLASTANNVVLNINAPSSPSGALQGLAALNVNNTLTLNTSPNNASTPYTITTTGNALLNLNNGVILYSSLLDTQGSQTTISGAGGVRLVGAGALYNAYSGDKISVSIAGDGQSVQQMTVTGTLSPQGALSDIHTLKINNGSTLVVNAGNPILRSVQLNLLAGSQTTPSQVILQDQISSADHPICLQAGANTKLSLQNSIPLYLSDLSAPITHNQTSGMISGSATPGVVLVGDNTTFIYSNSNSLQGLSVALSGYNVGGTRYSNQKFLLQNSLSTQAPVTDIDLIEVAANQTLTINHPITNSKSVMTISLDSGASVVIGAGASLAGQLSGSPGSQVNFNSNYSSQGPIQSVDTLNVAQQTTLQINHSYKGYLAQNGFNIPLNASVILAPGGSLTDPGVQLAGSLTYTGGTLDLSALQSPGTGQLFINADYTSQQDLLNLQQLSIGAGHTLNQASQLAANLISNQGTLLLTGGSLSGPVFNNSGSFWQTGGSFNTLQLNNTGVLKGAVSLVSPNQVVNLNAASVFDGSTSSMIIGTPGQAQVINFNQTLTLPDANSMTSLITGVDTLNFNANVALGTNINLSFDSATLASGKFVSLAPTARLTGRQVNVAGTLQVADDGLHVTDLNLIGAGQLQGAGSLSNLQHLNINNTGYSFTPSSALTIGQNIQIAAQGRLNINQGVTVPMLTNGGQLSVSGAQVLTGDYQQSASGSLNFSLTSQQQYDSLSVSASATFDPASTLNIQLGWGGMNIYTGDMFELFQAQTINGQPLVNYLAPSHILKFDYQYNNQTLQLIARRTDITTATTNSNATAIASQLEALPRLSLDVSQIIMQIFQAPTATALNQVIQQFDVANAHASLVKLSDVNQSLASSKVFSRLDAVQEVMHASGPSNQRFKAQHYLRQERLNLPASPGRLSKSAFNNGLSVMPIAFMNRVQQAGLADAPGYSAQAQGTGLLMDRRLAIDAHLGVGLVVSRNRVRTTEAYPSISSLRGTQVMLYGQRRFNAWIFDGVAAYTHSHNHLRKALTLDGLNIDGQFASRVILTQGRIGYALGAGQFRVTPLFSMQYQQYLQDAYQQTQAGSFNQSVAEIQTRNLQMSLGLNLSFEDRTNWPKFANLHAEVLRDAARKPTLYHSNFLSGGAPIVTSAPLGPRTGYKLGAGYSVQRGKNLLSIDGELEWRPGFASQSGLVKLRFSF